MRDVEAAFHAAMTLQPEHMRADFLREVFEGAGQYSSRQNREPETVYALLESIADDDLRHYLAGSAVGGIVSEMPERYSEIAQKYPAQWRDIYRQAFRTLAETDAARAIAELDNVPSSRRKVAVEALLDGWTYGGGPDGSAKVANRSGEPCGR
jgi:hypothetical protein